jgi:hypothetical protein
MRRRPGRLEPGTGYNAALMSTVDKQILTFPAALRGPNPGDTGLREVGERCGRLPPPAFSRLTDPLEPGCHTF